MKKISLIFIIGFQLVSFSQNKSIEIDAGFWSKTKLFEGYYFSSNIKIPLTNTLKISPTFTYGETFPNGYNTLIITEFYETIGYEQGKLKSLYDDIHFSSLDLILFVDFLHLINKNNSKSELFIGTGFGYKSYFYSKIKYNNVNYPPYLISLNIKKDNGFEPYYLNILYNFKLKDNIYLGLNASVNSIDGEGMLLYGFNAGVEF